MLGAGPRVVTRHLFGREGVEVTAHAFDRFGNFAGGPLRRSLEEHVFQEMEDAVLALRFMPPPTPSQKPTETLST
jgi:hypothetical protein